MRIAVEGCCHGELDKIYETLEYIEKRNGVKVDLLLICGDFQAVRNRADLQCMNVTQKYRRMNTFYKYYSGERTAPYLTVFIGGNHEASNYMQELPYGGWVAPNIYYMGYAGVIQFAGVRIGGLSGIFKGKDAHRGHFECPPYSAETIRSVYHTREFEVFRLKQITRPLDIFLSHDWPRGIYHYGNVGQLLQRKPFFREEVERDTLGSPLAHDLLHHLKPDYWFAAHLHVKFPAIVQHQLDNGADKLTKFLSLDKCLPKRKFLQILEIPHNPDREMRIELDPEWLVILKSTNHLLNLTKVNRFMPGPGSSDRWDFTVSQEEMNTVVEDFGGDLSLPENFEQTAPTYDPAESAKKSVKQPEVKVNPQTTLLCTMLDITDPNAVFLGTDSHIKLETLKDLEAAEGATDDTDDVDDEVDDDDTEYESEASFISQSGSERSFLSSTANNSLLPNPGNKSLDDSQNVSINPEEIPLSDEEENRELGDSKNNSLLEGEFNDSKNNSLVEGELSISDDEEFKEMMNQQKEYQSSSSADEKFSSPMKTSESVSPSHASSSVSTDDVDKSSSPSKSVSSMCMSEESEAETSGVREGRNSGESKSVQERLSTGALSTMTTTGLFELAADDGHHGDDPGDIILLTPQSESCKSTLASTNFSVKQQKSDLLPQKPDLLLPLPSSKLSLSPSSGEDKSDWEVTRETRGLTLSGQTTHAGERAESGERRLSRKGDNNEEESPQTKRFKRRNQQIYTESGDSGV